MSKVMMDNENKRSQTLTKTTKVAARRLRNDLDLVSDRNFIAMLPDQTNFRQTLEHISFTLCSSTLTHIFRVLALFQSRREQLAPRKHSTRGRVPAPQTRPRARHVRERSSTFGGHQATRQLARELDARATVHVLLPASLSEAPLCRDMRPAAQRRRVP